MSHTILVIDDDESKREGLVDHVLLLGYEAITAENGLEGLVMARIKDPDLILLDLVMPEMNGIECLHELKSDNKLRDIPVIIISGQDSSDQVVQCIENGAVDFLRMPPELAILKARINSSLERRSQQRNQAKMQDRLERLVLKVRETEMRADGLLRAIFPRDCLAELKETNDIKPLRHENIAVLFCDIVGFTSYCDQHDPEEAIVPLRMLLEAYEDVVERNGCEKIKTVGDCFMAAGGLRGGDDQDAVFNCVKSGMEMTASVGQLEVPWNVRVGIHVGALVAGKIGKKKYTYDVWGDTVNTAARIESAGIPGKVVVSRTAWEQVEARCRGESLGMIDLKGKDNLELFRVDAVIADAAQS